MPDVGFYKGQAPTTQNNGTTATVLSDGVTTSSVNLYDCTPTGILVPSGLNSSYITFQTCLDNYDGEGVFFDVKNPDDSTVYAIAIDNAGGDYVIDATRFAGRSWIRMLLGSSETPGTTLILIPWLV